jgi:predicted Fe-Mo cluster-binding NifX family protein
LAKTTEKMYGQPPGEQAEAFAKKRGGTMVEKKSYLLVASKEDGDRAIQLLKSAGVSPEVISVRPEVGEASVELLAPEGNFDGLARIGNYVEFLKRRRDER